MYQKARGRVRVVLVLWTLAVLVAGAVWWWRRDTPPAPRVPPSAVFELLIDTNRPDRIDVELALTGLRGPVRLTGVDLLPGARACAADGAALAVEAGSHEIAFDAPADDPVVVRYAVPIGRVERATLVGINTRYGGLARLDRLLVRPQSHPDTSLRVNARLPVGWRLHYADGMRPDGSVTAAAFDHGVLGWTHSASQGLLSRPNDVTVIFVGRPGINDPLLAAIAALSRHMLKEVLALGEELAHRVLVFDLPARHLRLRVPPQRAWSAIEHGPVCRHRVVRIARGLLARNRLSQSATPPGENGAWYPACLAHYAPFRLAQAIEVMPIPAWRGDWNDLDTDLLRAWAAGRSDARAIGAARYFADLQPTFPNAKSVRLLRIPARSASRLTFERAVGDQLDMHPQQAVAAFAALRARPYLPEESLFRQPLPYESLRPPSAALDAVDLRLVVSSELYASVEGCGGCPTPGSLAQWVTWCRTLAASAPTICVDAGDWTPFVLDDTGNGSDEDRVRLARRAAEIAGLEALVLGPNEVGAGKERLLARLGETESSPPLISGNVGVGDVAPEGYRIVERGGRRIALVGITDFPRRRYRLDWFEEALLEVTVSDPVRRTREVAIAARAAGADLVIGIGAVDPLNARQIAATDAVDLIVSSAPAFDRPPAEGDGEFTGRDTSGFLGPVPIVYGSGTRGSVTRIDLRITSDGGRARIIDFTSAPIELDRVEPDPDVQRLAEAYRSRNAR